MTKYQVPIAGEVRHALEGATVFSELDMGNVFHQVPLHSATSKLAVFQTHKGLHRMKHLFFGPRPVTGIFHHVVSKCFLGLEEVISIHDNILVYGKDAEEHNKYLLRMLERAEQIGI